MTACYGARKAPFSYPTHINIAQARLPETYESAKRELANCARIDECQEWANKAEAMASYARMADDDTRRKLADRIQARAVRRCGELLKQIDGRGGDRSKNGGAPTSALRRDVAAAAGMSKDQQVTAVRVANVPADDFERQIDSDTPPTVTELAKQGTQTRVKNWGLGDDWNPPEGFAKATHLLGEVRDFAAGRQRRHEDFERQIDSDTRCREWTAVTNRQGLFYARCTTVYHPDHHPKPRGDWWHCS